MVYRLKPEVYDKIKRVVPAAPSDKECMSIILAAIMYYEDTNALEYASYIVRIITEKCEATK